MTNIAFAEEVVTNIAPTNPMSSLQNGGIMSFLPFIMIFVVFYFMLIRPQMKKQKEHQALLTNLKRGDKVVTSSGIMGTINKIEDDNSAVILEIAPEVKIKIVKSSIVEVNSTETAKI